MQNSFCESFDGRIRDELLNESLYFSPGHAKAKIAGWIDDYNERNMRSAAQPRPAPQVVCCYPALYGVKPTETLIAAG